MMRWCLWGVLLVALTGGSQGCVRLPDAPAVPATELPGAGGTDGQVAAQQGVFFAYGTYIGLLAVLALVAAIALPVAKKTLYTLAVALAGGMVVAYSFGHILPWIIWLALGMFATGIGYAIYRLVKVLYKAIQTVEVVVDKDDPAADAIKDHMRRVQGPEQPELKRIAAQVRQKKSRAQAKLQRG
jgi:hypothetical protein